MSTLQQTCRKESMAPMDSQSSFTRMKTTFPAQTPVAWATAACSANPGTTSIADFVGRDPRQMSLYLTLGKAETRRVGLRRPMRWAVALLAGVLTFPLWVALSRAPFRGARALSRRSAWARGAMAGCGSLLVFFVSGRALTDWLPLNLQSPVNLRQGLPFWKVTSRLSP